MIFDKNLIQLHHNYAKQNIGESDFLIEHAASSLIHDIQMLKMSPQSILELGPRAGNLSTKLRHKYKDAQYFSANLEPDAFTQKFDLIISCMNFHWINEVEKHLRSILTALNEEGKYVLNFVVSGSLEHLKKHLITCEIEANIPHRPHIIPLPKEDKIQTIFTQCGFKFVIVTTENIDLEYRNPVKLMKDLKNMGENNALVQDITALPRSALSWKKGLFTDNIKLVTVVAGNNSPVTL